MPFGERLIDLIEEYVGYQAGQCSTLRNTNFCVLEGAVGSAQLQFVINPGETAALQVAVGKVAPLRIVQRPYVLVETV